MISRPAYLERIANGLEHNPIVMLLGARQVGKSTLARQALEGQEGHYFDLEDPAAIRVLEQPMSTLENLRGLVVIDEAQRVPALFPVLRVLSDRVDASTKFLLLGSASPALSRQSNESLAGRAEIIHVQGISLDEAGPDKRDEL